MTDKQAENIISLLEDIKSLLSDIETNTQDNYKISNKLDHIANNL